MKHKIKIETLIAQIISVVTNPFLIFAIAFVSANLSTINENAGAFIMFLIVSVGPAFMFYNYEIFHHKKHPLHFVSIQREKRNKIYLIALYSLVLSAIFYSYIGIPFWAANAMLLAIFVGSIYFINTFVDMASVHAAVFSFSVLYLADRINLAFALLFILLPIIYWSRIELHKHTWLQLLLGSTVGMCIGLLSWVIK